MTKAIETVTHVHFEGERVDLPAAISVPHMSEGEIIRRLEGHPQAAKTTQKKLGVLNSAKPH